MTSKLTELESANECVIEILESYLEFVDMADRCIDAGIFDVLKDVCKTRKSVWQPILDVAKAKRNEYKDKLNA